MVCTCTSIASCTDGAFHACSIKMGPVILYYGRVNVPHLSYMHYVYSSSVRACLCVTAQARLCVQHSAFCAHRVHVGVLWNSSYKCTFTTTDILTCDFWDARALNIDS